MHSKFLRYLDAVARHGSIRKAGAVLNVSSTTVNRKLLDVERNLGVRLFDRTSEGVVLTPAGSIVVEHCRRTLYDFERLRESVDDIRAARSEHITIMSLDSASLGLLPDVLSNFSSVYPRVTYSVTTSQPEDIVKSVAEGRADIGFSFTNKDHPDIRVMMEKAAPIGVVLRSDHPLAERTKLVVGNLKDYMLVRPVDARGRRSLFDAAVDGVAENMPTRLFTDSLPAAKKMIEDGQAMGLYTKLGFREEISAGTLRFIPLENDLLESLKVGIMISSRSGLSPVKHALATQIGKTIATLQLD
ncbi:MAG: LysR family transcriptional regulator [Rhodobacteraceae bacterium]|nr:LysR family transcriptional regulator [Paracoccaceae bacterium]MCY4198105.1 LysR family transcriptional regulator [Paracoccaceae bacterium]MCY4326649.1 LysR family transcriptional regulator [Paracoccaceae bacterium]